MSAADLAWIEAAYEGPLEDPPWRSLLETLRADLGALATTCILRSAADPGLGRVLSSGLRRFESAYQSRYFASDPFVNLPEGEVTALSDVVSARELHASAFYRELLEPAGIEQVLGVDLAVDVLTARLRISLGPGARRFAAAERARLAELVPQLRRALRIYARLTETEGERDVYANAVGELALATILLDERGHVVSRNASGSARDTGLGERDGELVAATPQDTRRLRDAVARALAARAHGDPTLAEALRLRGPRGGPELALLIRALPPTSAARGRAGPAVAIFGGNPAAAAEIPSETLRVLFGLTRAEAALAARLAAGDSLDAAAAALGIARNTARAHLRAVFAKTGASRQAELVRLLLRSAARLAGN